MIYRDKVRAALDLRRREFERFDSEIAASCALYRKALAEIAASGSNRLLERLADKPFPGALPVEEFGGGSIIVALGVDWPSHEEARAWAYHKLLGRTTFAADGSQIVPTKDYSIPV
ncbi:MAG: hypothetical protein ACREDR_45135, partial [Blastocatellia bacterium]